MTTRVTYRDEDHTYWCGTDRYLSATQILDRFKNKFDTEEVAKYMEERYTAPTEVWKERWDDTRETSLVRGNRIHNQREELTLSKGMEVHQGKALPVPNPALYPEFTPLFQMPDGIYTEQLLFNHQHKIAGRCDKVILTSNSGYRTADIDDYKTNRIIRTRAFVDKNGKLRMMKEPIAHLQDCTMIHYELQLSLYAFMLESMGFRIGQLRIIHFPHILKMAPLGAKPPAPKIYVAPYRRNDVISLLQQLANEQVPSTEVPIL